MRYTAVKTGVKYGYQPSTLWPVRPVFVTKKHDHGQVRVVSADPSAPLENLAMTIDVEQTREQGKAVYRQDVVDWQDTDVRALSAWTDEMQAAHERRVRRANTVRMALYRAAMAGADEDTLAALSDGRITTADEALRLEHDRALDVLRGDEIGVPIDYFLALLNRVTLEG